MSYWLLRNVWIQRASVLIVFDVLMLFFHPALIIGGVTFITGGNTGGP